MQAFNRAVTLQQQIVMEPQPGHCPSITYISGTSVTVGMLLVLSAVSARFIGSGGLPSKDGLPSNEAHPSQEDQPSRERGKGEGASSEVLLYCIGVPEVAVAQSMVCVSLEGRERTLPALALR